MEVSRYYTPSLEEFHVGFEFEVESKNVVENKIVWSKFNDPLRQDTLEWLIENDKVRIKYLDSEDIESLGFNETYDDTEGNVWFKSNKSDKIRLCFIDGLNFNIEICDSSNHCNNDTIFKGSVKNKSELKRILKMIGVIE